MKRQGYEDEDFGAALDEYEEILAERDEARERHRKELRAISDRLKTKVNSSCKEFGIDRDIFLAVIADRIEDRKYEDRKKARAAKIPASKIELYIDAVGQFSWLAPAPVDGTVIETPAMLAARARAEKIAAITEAEQAEGAAVLDELTAPLH